jgi:WD40 repeat protein
MEGALRASVQGLELVDQARKRRGWNRQSAAWAQMALTTVASLKLFWRRERLSQETFAHICEAVGVDWQKVIEAPICQSGIVDWGEAPDLTFFCGRSEELQTLTQWMVTDACKVILLLGMGGMGKTTLAVRLIERVLDQFAFVVWRSLRNAPPAEMLIRDLLNCFTEIAGDSDADPISQLMARLRQHRCLVVLDNAESILTTGGSYAPGYEPYGELIRRMGEERHPSCLLLTSREQLREVNGLAGERVRSLRLQGLPLEAGQQILERIGAIATAPDLSRQIVEHYGGNPLALKIAAAGIRDLLHGNVTEFLHLLQQGTFVFGDIQDLLERHFDRLSIWEQEIMYWLAIAREPLSLEELKRDLVSPESFWQLTDSLDSLKRRSLLETGQNGMSQQPAVMEFVTRRLIEKIQGEIITGNLSLFRSHALVKATAKDYVREAQIRLILAPLATKLQSFYDTAADLKNALLGLLPPLQGKPPIKTGYVAGNVLNFLVHLHADLTDLDCSRLTVWQADLREATLHGVNFTASNLRHSLFTETFSNVLCVVFSPNGELLAKSDDLGWIRIWQVATGQPLLSFRAHENWVFALAFSPDGCILASGGLEGQVKLWDLTQGRCIQTIHAHSEGVASVAFSGDGKLLASGGSDQTVKLTEVKTGKCLRTLNAHQGIVRAIAFAPSYFFSSSINDSFPFHPETILSQDALLERGLHSSLVSASLDGTLRLWDIETGCCLQTFVASAALHTVAFLPQFDGSLHLASAGEDGKIYLWDVATGGSIGCLETGDSQLSGMSHRVWNLVASPNGETLFSTGDDALIRLWHLPDLSCLKILPGHTSRIWSLTLSPDGQTLVSGSDDQSIRFWSVQNGQCLRILRGYYNHTAPIAFTQAGLLTFSMDQTLRWWDLTTRQCLKTLYFPAKAALHVALSPDQSMLEIGSVDYTVRLYDLTHGALLKTFHGHLAWVRGVAFSPDGKWLVSASGDQTIKLWRVATGECLRTFAGHTSPVRSVAFHPTGKFLASGSWDKTLKLWDVEQETCLKTFQGHTGQVRQVIFSPDGRWLISCGQDCTVRRWHLEHSDDCQVLQGHTAAVEAIACSPNSAWIASVSTDETLRFWQVENGMSCQKLPEQIQHNSSLMFSPDHQWLAIGGENETCILWQMQPSDSLSPLSILFKERYVLQVPRPYEGMIITDAEALTEAQRLTLQALGASGDR